MNVEFFHTGVMKYSFAILTLGFDLFQLLAVLMFLVPVLNVFLAAM